MYRSGSTPTGNYTPSARSGQQTGDNSGFGNNLTRGIVEDTATNFGGNNTNLINRNRTSAGGSIASTGYSASSLNQNTQDASLIQDDIFDSTVLLLKAYKKKYGPVDEERLRKFISDLNTFATIYFADDLIASTSNQSGSRGYSTTRGNSQY